MVHKQKCIPKMHRLNLSPLFLFCLFTQSSSAWSIHSHVDIDDTGTHIVSQSYHLAFQVDNHNSDFLHSSFQPPAEPAPTPNEPREKKDDKENQNDDEWSGFHFRFYGGFDFLLESFGVSIAQIEQNILKRTKISLVVLYHSWKSFPS